MKARVDATVENLREILGHYGPSDVGFPIMAMLTAPGQATVNLMVAWKPEAPGDDPWQLRDWQMGQVRQCIADLAAAGWYLASSRLRIEFNADVKGGTFTLTGDLHEEPQERVCACSATFEVQGFPPHD